MTNEDARSRLNVRRNQILGYPGLFRILVAQIRGFVISVDPRCRMINLSILIIGFASGERPFRRQTPSLRRSLEPQVVGGATEVRPCASRPTLEEFYQTRQAGVMMRETRRIKQWHAWRDEGGRFDKTALLESKGVHSWFYWIMYPVVNTQPMLKILSLESARGLGILDRRLVWLLYEYYLGIRGLGQAFRLLEPLWK